MNKKLEDSMRMWIEEFKVGSLFGKNLTKDDCVELRRVLEHALMYLESSVFKVKKK